MDRKQDTFEVLLANLDDEEAPLVTVEVSVYNGVSRGLAARKVYTTKILVPAPNSSKTRFTDKGRDKVMKLSSDMVATCYGPISMEEQTYV